MYDQAAIQELSEQLTALQEEHALSQNQSDKALVDDLMCMFGCWHFRFEGVMSSGCIPIRSTT